MPHALHHFVHGEGVGIDVGTVERAGLDRHAPEKQALDQGGGSRNRAIADGTDATVVHIGLLLAVGPDGQRPQCGGTRMYLGGAFPA
jgi:hypothetical protein